MNSEVELRKSLMIKSDFLFIEFLTSYPTKSTFIKFPARLQEDVETIQYALDRPQKIRFILHSTMTSHYSEALGNLVENLRMMKLQLRPNKIQDLEFNQIPARPYHVTKRRNLLNSGKEYYKAYRTQNNGINCYWNVKHCIFTYPANLWTLPPRNPQITNLQPYKPYTPDLITPYETNEKKRTLIPMRIGATNFFMVLTAYKHVGEKIHPISTQFPLDC
jgi:hypothetical protein